MSYYVRYHVGRNGLTYLPRSSCGRCGRGGWVTAFVVGREKKVWFEPIRWHARGVQPRAPPLETCPKTLLLSHTHPYLSLDTGERLIVLTTAGPGTSQKEKRKSELSRLCFSAREMALARPYTIGWASVPCSCSLLSCIQLLCSMFLSVSQSLSKTWCLDICCECRL